MSHFEVFFSSVLLLSKWSCLNYMHMFRAWKKFFFWPNFEFIFLLMYKMTSLNHANWRHHKKKVFLLFLKKLFVNTHKFVFWNVKSTIYGITVHFKKREQNSFWYLHHFQTLLFFTNCFFLINVCNLSQLISQNTVFQQHFPFCLCLQDAVNTCLNLTVLATFTFSAWSLCKKCLSIAPLMPIRRK